MRQALVVFFLSAGDSVPCNLIEQRFVNRASFYKFNAHSDPYRPCLESHIELKDDSIVVGGVEIVPHYKHIVRRARIILLARHRKLRIRWDSFQIVLFFCEGEVR